MKSDNTLSTDTPIIKDISKMKGIDNTLSITQKFENEKEIRYAMITGKIPQNVSYDNKYAMSDSEMEYFDKIQNMKSDHDSVNTDNTQIQNDRIREKFHKEFPTKFEEYKFKTFSPTNTNSTFNVQSANEPTWETYMYK
jgi:uncharacterized protein with gpF-like domain